MSTRGDRTVVISGVGLVTPYGHGEWALWDGLSTGRTALDVPRRFRADCWTGEPVGEVAGSPANGTAKYVHLASAVTEAWSSAGLDGPPADALTVLVGQAPVGQGDERTDDVDWSDFVGPALPPGAVDRTVYLTHACASAAFAVALGRTAIRSGAADVVLVAGASALNRYEYSSMKAVRAVGTHAARPFDQSRGGISVGEGGGALVLERRDRARARGAATDAVVAGASCGVGGGSATASEAGLIEAYVRRALADAGRTRLDYVHAHATGTPQGDHEELVALQQVADDLGLSDLPVDSHKGAIGHLLHASCLPGIGITLRVLRERRTTGTTGLSDPEPTTSLTLSPTPIRLASGGPLVAAVTSFGFGSNNATVILTHDPDDER